MLFRLEHIVSSLLTWPISGAPAGLLPDSAFEIDRSHHSASPLDEDSLVSIIIPCYNGEAYLQEAIESALAQTYQPVEVIVVDDGSTDRSSEIALKFPVRYIRQPNRGLTKSRNLGVGKSRASYVVFLDADDRLKPDAITTGIRVLAERPECAMAVGDHVFVSREGRQLADSLKECLPASHYEALLKSNFIEMISTVLFRRSVLEDVGGFDTRLRVAEDYELYLRIARDYPICCHSTVVAEYRMHQANASHNSALMLAMTLEVLKSQQRYVRGDARRLFAFLEGIRGWRKQYGRQLASELARSYRTLQMDDLRRKLLLLVMHYPQGLLVFLLLRLAPRLDKRYAGSHGGYTLSQRLQAWSNAAKAQSSTQLG
jgi:glycosyltransferase involved in cell wall biosynthesis